MSDFQRKFDRAKAEAELKVGMDLRVKARDLAHLDPRERANLANTLLFEALGLKEAKDVIKMPLYWDLTCWAIELIAGFALGLNEDGMIRLAKLMSSHIYSIHYSMSNGSDALGPSKEEHVALWDARITKLKEALDEDNKVKEAWKVIRAKVERTAAEYNDEMGHELCPWIFDASELPDALKYIDTVINYDPR